MCFAVLVHKSQMSKEQAFLALAKGQKLDDRRKAAPGNPPPETLVVDLFAKPNVMLCGPHLSKAEN
jgi:hypothetical protein